MPANLPPDYYAAEKRLREADTPQQKIDILREMLAIMPKHKGTEHLQGDLKRRIAKLSSQAQKKQATARSTGLDHIPREGAGQVVLVGAPNSGKSSLLIHLTNAHSDVAEYPFSTYKPVVGMVAYEDIQIQLVDLPPVSREYEESWLYNIIRLSDVVLFTVDLSTENIETQAQEVLSILEEHRILLRKEGERRPQGSVAVKTVFLLGTKADTSHAPRNAETIQNLFSEEVAVDAVTVKNQGNLDALRRRLFEMLKVVRVYTKIPGHKADMGNPYVVLKGTTVQEAAKAIHKELAESMTFARLWGSDGYDGRRVERDHVLKDKDILEVHTR